MSDDPFKDDDRVWIHRVIDVAYSAEMMKKKGNNSRNADPPVSIDDIVCRYEGHVMIPVVNRFA